MLYRHFVIILVFAVFLVHCAEWRYHNNTDLELFLKNFNQSTKSGIATKLYSIGKSRKGNDLWVLQLTATKKRKTGIPNIKLIGTIHGNEPVGREIILHFMEFLRDGYGSDPVVTWLLDNTRIHFLPNMNPDGFALSHENMCDGEHVRNNGLGGKDLNRNFPDFYHKNRIPEEPETKAVKKWLEDVPFILSAALHGGAMVVNYPFDTVKESTSDMENPPSLTPDHDVFVHLAQVYSQNHPTMHKGDSCSDSKFEGGIVNGAVWYPIIGGMQDYNYAFHGCMELTLEISCCKYPAASELPKLWQDNKMALLKYCLEALRGVTGQILDSTSRKPIAKATLRVSGKNMTFSSSKTGEFWRLLLPGNYKLEVSAEGYYNQVVSFVVKKYETNPKLTSLKILMLNSSISTTSSTTPKQRTTGTTVKFTRSITDGAPITVSSAGVIPSEDHQPPTPASLITPLEKSSSTVHQNYIFYVSLVIFLLL
ncbi:hypothetical protein Zmor_026321 [Zophobas morio]|uniref:Peptidase M14 domain-containing protein n=1 Tax=Zophobas morio TaxID=2755281 RepID=A0AA38HU26_9CUCU|nr:hypothetical protein Zmor_026321 [Zophobas morio]